VDIAFLIPRMTAVAAITAISLVFLSVLCGQRVFRSRAMAAVAAITAIFLP
jgi:hypothetical protein